MFGRVDAEEGEATGQHRPGGFGECEPGPVGGRGFLVADGQRAAGLLEVQERLRGAFEMAGDPVGGAQTGGGGEYAGVVADAVDKRVGFRFDGLRRAAVPGMPRARRCGRGRGYGRGRTAP